MQTPATSTSFNFLSIKDKYCSTNLSQSFNLNVIQPKSGSFSPTVCIGETFTYKGTVYNALFNSDKILLKNGAASGCDSIVDFKLNFFAPIVNNVDQILCFGQSLTFNNVVYSELKPTGTEVIKNGASNGCDSTININLTYTNAVVNNLKPIICVGENVLINGKIYDVNNQTGSDTLKGGSYSGCDSIINVKLSFYPPANANFNTTLCIGETITIGNTTFSESNNTGVVTLKNQSSHGCDSTINVSLNFFAKSTGNVNKTLCAGEKIIIAGKTFNETNPSDSVIITKGSKNGCDTIIYVQLTYLQPVTNNIVESICPGTNKIINGNIYGAAGKLNGKETIINGAKNGCDSIINVNLSFFPTAVTNISQSLCLGQQITVNGKIYNQQNPKGTEVIKNITKNGCDSIINVDLKFINPSTKNINSTICKEANLSINGKIYDINKPSGIDTLKNGASSGCDSILLINLSFYPKDTFFLTQQLCEGQSVTVNNVVYNQNKTKGLEILKNQSKFGCDSIVKIDLSFNKASTNTIKDTLCIGEFRNVNGKIYNEQNKSGVEILKNGNSNGCDSSIQINLTYRPDITASISGNVTICKGKPVNIPFNISGGTTYDVVLGSSTGPDIILNNINGNYIHQLTPTVSTTYVIKSVKINGLQPCKTTILGNFTVTVDDLSLTVKVKDYNGFNVSCPGSNDGSAEVISNNAISNLSIKWSNGKTGNLITGLAAGTYYVTISSVGGCSTIDSAKIIQPTPMDISAILKSPKCFDGEEGEISINQPIGGANPISFSIDNKIFFPAISYPYIFDHKKPGKYTIYIKDANGCKTTKTFEILNVKKLELELGADTTIHFGDSIQLKPVTNFNVKSLIWEPNLYLSCDTCLSPFVKPISDFIGYKLILQDSSGCQIVDNITIKTNKNKHVFIPNTFTPDDEDGSNTIFYIFGSEDVLSIEKFMVFDRWGNQLFRADNFAPNDPQYGWDGKFQTKSMNPGVYVYYAKVIFKDGTEQIFKGDVSLIR
ncbi:MAG: gliding motility-associated C-terminal domain-containing protein [Saprospiraceae bacterium]|nr:gliding motility-associated C-terminal domain-containing protein [Saprospiraceae bacterium]